MVTIMQKYNHFEIEKMLDSMVVLYDTREQDTPALHRRLEGLNRPFEREMLDYGDYSCKFTKLDGEVISIANKVVIERKMSVDELCGCFTKSRARFEREFLRAKEDGARIHLLVENATWENILTGKYRSQINPSSLTASILAWSERYNMIPVFCKAESSGRLIERILHYSLKGMLDRGEV